jgi:hypothetical protein
VHTVGKTNNHRKINKMIIIKKIQVTYILRVNGFLKKVTGYWLQRAPAPSFPLVSSETVLPFCFKIHPIYSTYICLRTVKHDTHNHQICISAKHYSSYAFNKYYAYHSKEAGSLESTFLVTFSAICKCTGTDTADLNGEE